jgi:hypothetical protein
LKTAFLRAWFWFQFYLVNVFYTIVVQEIRNMK